MAKSELVVNAKATTEQSWGLSAMDQKELGQIEVEISELHQETESTLKTAFIKFGDMLCEARSLIADDIKFGEWRVAKTPFDSKQTANSAMQLSRAISENVITKKMIDSNMGQSHLVELSRASLVVQSQVEDLIKEGKTPTIKQIRAWKKEAEDRVNGTYKEKNIIEHKNPDGQEQEGNFKDGYNIKGDEKPMPTPSKDTDTPPITRSLPDQALDLVNEGEQTIEDLMQTTIDLHKVLEQLKDGQAKKLINELRVVLKDAQGKLEELFEHVEETHID